MIDLSNLFDSYNKKARLYPALIVLLPPLLLLLAWFPDLLTSNIGATLLSIGVSCGLLYTLAAYARSCGKALEGRLLRTWGGWPTTLWLRHQDGHLDAPTRARYHAFLAASLPDLQFPTPGWEQTDPVTADAVYGSAVNWLKERCRGKEFILVHKENAEYGFRRNLRGLRRSAIALLLGGMVLSLLVAADGVGRDALWRALDETPVGGLGMLAREFPVAVRGMLLVNVLVAVWWLATVRDRWVRQAADQYARALLACCETLPRPVVQKRRRA